MQRILILLAHPAFERSRINATLIDVAQSLEGVTVNDLYQHYPDFMIDVQREQALLLEHEVIVFQHPLYWYSAPALLKEWQDVVLEHGFGRNRTDNSLNNKYLINMISVGSSEASYQLSGRHNFTIRQLFAPFEQTALLCNMHYLEPFVIYNANALSELQIATHVERYKIALTALQRGDSWS